MKYTSAQHASQKIGFVETPPEIAQLMVKLSNVHKKGLILDTGCGRGVFLNELNKGGFNNCYGIEFDQELYEFCKIKYGEKFKIISGDFITYDFKERFDLIIGNPPYAHFNQLPSELAQVVKKIIGTSESDIYYAFIIKSIFLLKPGGELIYIVPYHFFYNTYAKIVRETLLKYGKIEIIIDLDEKHLFNNENPEIIIFKFIKGNFNLEREKIHLLNIKNKKISIENIYNIALHTLETRKTNEFFEYQEIPHYLNTNHWSSFYTSIPKYPSIKLKEIAKVGVGLVSGFDKAFILDNNLISDFKEAERNIIKKFVKGKNCNRFLIDGYTSYILINDDIKKEEHLQQMHPKIYEKIKNYKTEMSKRYLPNQKKWFHWQALRNYNFLITNINKKRIFVPCLDRHPYNRFSLGENNLLPAGDVLFIQPKNDNDLYFLLGYLNSTFFRKYYLAKGGRRGGRVSFTQRLLEKVEIPLFSNKVKDEIIKTTLNIINALKQNNSTNDMETYLDNIIFSAIENKNFDPSTKVSSDKQTILIFNENFSSYQ